ncbi:small ribosomal subunit protein bS16m [Aegotheles albertisi]
MNKKKEGRKILVTVHCDAEKMHRVTERARNQKDYQWWEMFVQSLAVIGTLNLVLTPYLSIANTGSRLLKGYRGGHVVIRFALGGCTNRPFFRIVAAHSRRARGGKYLEQLGCLDPLPNAHGERVAGLNLERLRHWLGCGAQLSRPAEKLLGLAGFLPLHPMTVTGAERLRRRQRAQEAAPPPLEGSPAPGDTP